MSGIKHVSRPLLGPGEWLGQYLRLLAQAVDDRPVGSTEAPTDWRYDSLFQSLNESGTG